MIKYYKLFDLMSRKGMKKTDLRKVISPKTAAKLSKGEYVGGETIEKLCKLLHCQPGNIMEYVERITMEDGTIQEIVPQLNGKDYISYFPDEEQYSPEYRVNTEFVKDMK